MASISGIIREHNKYIKNHINDKEFIKKHKEVVEIMEKERLFHLLVTMFTILFTFLTLILFYLSNIKGFLWLFLILLILSFSYLVFYFILENTLIKWEYIIKDYEDKGNNGL